MADCGFDQDDFYTALGDSSFYDVCDPFGKSSSDEDEIRRKDCILADKLDEIAHTLRCGSPKETSPKDSTPRMPLRELLCAVEKRLKEILKENSSCTTRSAQEICVPCDPCGDSGLSSKTRSRRSSSPSSCNDTWASSRRSSRLSSSSDPCDDSWPRRLSISSSSTNPLDDTWGSERRGSSLYKGSPLRPPPTCSPDPERMAQIYFEDEDQILCTPGQDLKGNVAQILQRRRLARKKITPGCRTPVRQLCAVPVQDAPQEDCELLGVTPVATSDYGDILAQALDKARCVVTPNKSRSCMKVSTPKLRLCRDPCDDIDWSKAPPGKTYAEIVADKRREEEEIIDQFARQILLGTKAVPTSKIACKTPRRWSPERIATMGRRFGIPTSPCRPGQRQYLRHSIKDRIGLTSPPPEFFEVDDIDDIDV